MYFKILPSITFLILVVADIVSLFLMPSPGIPGLHDSLISRCGIIAEFLATVPLLVFSVRGYFILSRTKKQIPIFIFLTHLLLTTPLIVSYFLNFSVGYFSTETSTSPANQVENLVQKVQLGKEIVLYTFFLGQVLFAYYFSKYRNTI